jgi:hypothetical protein
LVSSNSSYIFINLLFSVVFLKLLIYGCCLFFGGGGYFLLFFTFGGGIFLSWLLMILQQAFSLLSKV